MVRTPTAGARGLPTVDSPTGAKHESGRSAVAVSVAASIGVGVGQFTKPDRLQPAPPKEVDPDKRIYRPSWQGP